MGQKRGKKSGVILALHPPDGGVEFQSGSVAFFNDSASRCSKIFQCASNLSVKDGPVETGATRISGAGGGGGHDWADWTGAPAQAVNSGAEASKSGSIFSIGEFLSLAIERDPRAGALLGGPVERLDGAPVAGKRLALVVPELAERAGSGHGQPEPQPGRGQQRQADHRTPSTRLAWSQRTQRSV